MRLAVYLKALACNFKRMVHARLVEMDNTAQRAVGTVPAVAASCWGSTRNRDCILYPGKGTVVLIRPAQIFYERINVVPYRTHVKGLVIPTEDAHTHTDFATVWLDRA